MTEKEIQQLKQLLSYSYALPASDSRYQSTMVFEVENLLGDVLRAELPCLDLAKVGQNFLGAIEDANKTDLVTRGPLDLKSSEMIPPLIVLDQEVSERVGGRVFLINSIFLL